MNNIKMETDFRLESLFISLNKDNINLLDDLLKLKELDYADKSNINKYISIVKQIGATPNTETLKKEFPDLYFDDIIPLKQDEINDYIRLFIGHQKNLAKSRLLLEVANKVRTNGMTEDVITLMNDITKSDIATIGHKDILKDLMSIYDSSISTKGIPTGVPQIDNDTGGLQLGALTVMLGWTGSGKTTWAINVAYNALINNFNVLYISLEVKKEHIFYDLLSRHSCEPKFNKKIEHSHLKQHKLSENDRKYFEEKIYKDFIDNTPGKIYVVDETELESYSTYTLQGKFNEIEKLAIKDTGHGIDLLVIDHAQLLKFSNSMSHIGNETNLTNAYVSFIRQQCMNWCKKGKAISGLLLSQASRTGWQDAVRNDGRYRLTALAEANELERGASLVLSVFCSETLKQMKEVKVQILKNRDGAVWAEPIEVPADFQYYSFGSNGSVAGLNASQELDIAAMGASIFGTDNDDSLNDLFGGDINNINLDL